jgi:hypothetical protein
MTGAGNLPVRVFEERPMTAFQYQMHCKKLGISVYRSAKVLGISLRQAQRYAKGEREIPKLVGIALRAMVRLGTIDV